MQDWLNNNSEYLLMGLSFFTIARAPFQYW